MTIFHKNENFSRINAKINRLFKKIYSNIPAKFDSDGCRLYWVIGKTKIDNWFLTPIQGFTQSKIEKAIKRRIKIKIYCKNFKNLPKANLVSQSKIFLPDSWLTYCFDETTFLIWPHDHVHMNIEYELLSWVFFSLFSCFALLKLSFFIWFFFINF